MRQQNNACRPFRPQACPSRLRGLSADLYSSAATQYRAEQILTTPDIGSLLERAYQVESRARELYRTADECCQRIAATRQQPAVTRSRLRAAAKTGPAVGPGGMRTHKWPDVLLAIRSAVDHDLDEDHGHAP